MVSVDEPRLQLLRNRLGDRFQENQAVEIRLVGGNDSAKPSTDWSSRDAYGAVVTITMGGVVRKFQLACSEGLASQNSRNILVGMGKAKKLDRVEVRWPSGRLSELDEIPAGQRLVIHEKQSQRD